AAFLFVTLGLVLVSVHLIFSSQIRRVAIGKKKVAVIGNRRVQRYDVDEVKWMKFLPMINMYCMKIKGRKGKIYFLPTEESEVIFGLFPSVAGVGRKK
ncbi:MAG: hypothetical protein ACOYW3_10745, partial [Bacteroidota bacterium]